MTITPFKLNNLPPTFPKEEAISIALIEEIPILKHHKKFKIG
jgi:hypothetical protein